MRKSSSRVRAGAFASAFAGALVLALASQPTRAAAEETGFAYRQAVIEAALADEDIATFYRAEGYAPLWTGSDAADAARRSALLQAFARAEDHGLPSGRYDAAALAERLRAANDPRALGLLEVEMTRLFLRYARDIQTGVLVPSQVNKHIVREIPLRDRGATLDLLAEAPARQVFSGLPPQSREYNDLMKHKLLLERALAAGGWGPVVTAGKLEAGDSGAEVVALRDRLVRMGYLDRSPVMVFDDRMREAVQRFQAAHGLAEDGVVGPGTLAEINVSVADRLASVIVAMERERWLNLDRGARHIEVNLADFSAKIVDDGKTTFRTRAVIGARPDKRQSPEFSDQMEFMVVNPSWFVPRSIATGEYLPELQQDPNAVSHLIITDRSGRQIDRASVDFTQFTQGNFPFAMRQPPSQSNALGLVKFMFPNKYNIYLHDTPAKNLFAREVRAYSHGCIRLADPFDFAYALLARQSDDPVGLFQAKLATGRETRIDLERPVPVHLIYRTAVVDDRGRIEFRRDIYGRDAEIWQALQEAGVSLRAVQG